MDARKKVLILSCIKSYLQSKTRRQRRRRLFLMQRYQGIELEFYKILFLSNLNTFRMFLPQVRRYWMTNYDQGWFERLWHERNDVIIRDIWVKEFRMLPETFHYVLDIVSPQLTKQDTLLRECVKVEKRVAIAIWRLATGISYRTVSRIFNVSKAFAVDALLSFVC